MTTNLQLEKILIRLQNLEQELQKSTISNKSILTFEEACITLSCSSSWLYKKTSANFIRHFKPNNGRLYFLKEDLEDYILKNSTRTDEELSIEARKWIHENINAKISA